jgi:hypothetical protein
MYWSQGWILMIKASQCLVVGTGDKQRSLNFVKKKCFASRQSWSFVDEFMNFKSLEDLFMQSVARVFLVFCSLWHFVRVVLEVWRFVGLNKGWFMGNRSRCHDSSRSAMTVLLKLRDCNNHPASPLAIHRRFPAKGNRNTKRSILHQST